MKTFRTRDQIPPTVLRLVGWLHGAKVQHESGQASCGWPADEFDLLSDHLGGHPLAFMARQMAMDAGMPPHGSAAASSLVFAAMLQTPNLHRFHRRVLTDTCTGCLRRRRMPWSSTSLHNTRPNSTGLRPGRGSDDT